MSVTNVLGRIQEIQSVLSSVSATRPQTLQAPASAAPASSVAAPGASGEAFAQTLETLLAGETAAAPAPSAPTPVSALPPSAPLPGSSAASEEAVAAATSKYVGLPYVWGGNDPAVGLDCSSFVQHVYRDVGIELPRVTWDQMKEGSAVASLAEARPGDLLFTRDGGHVSIYLGNGKAIDAPQPGTTIQVRDLWENDQNITAIRRILPPASDAAPVAAAAAALPAGDPGTGDLLAVAGPEAIEALLASARASRAAGAFG